jgi:periplasmic copper chaperone A
MNPKLVLAVLAGALIGAAAPASAQVVEVKDPWARATAPGQKAGGVFMQLKSPGGGALVAAESPAASIVEIHEMAMEGNVMKMRAVPRLDLPAGQTVELKPGGYHVMLIDLKAPLKKGDMVPVKLKVQGKDGKPAEIEVKAEVRDMGAGAGGAAKH